MSMHITERIRDYLETTADGPFEQVEHCKGLLDDWRESQAQAQAQLEGAHIVDLEKWIARLAGKLTRYQADDHEEDGRRWAAASTTLACQEFVSTWDQADTLEAFAFENAELVLEVAVKVRRITTNERERWTLFWVAVGDDVDDWQRRARLFVDG